MQQTLILGATGAVGGVLARRLRADGQSVILAGRRQDALDSLSKELDCPTVAFDARTPGSITTAIETAHRDHGGLTGIVCAIGSILLKPAHRTSDEEWDDTIELNLTAAFRTVRAAAAKVRSNASVVLVSSAAARLGMANHEAIAAAKAGIEGLTRAAAASYASRNLRINAVAPGLVDSTMAEPITKNEMVLKASTAMHALGRIGTPEDVASAIAWLVSPESSWVTGQVLGVDGGLGSVLSRRR
ncbi:MAG: SDR family oxidoreductase [Myxococcota bacterium]|nr:SDR family oxidoreductase [Myxococcota bacterium]